MIKYPLIKVRALSLGLWLGYGYLGARWSSGLERRTGDRVVLGSKRVGAAESGSIPLRNWIFLLIPSPIPELELNWNWLYPVQAELELN